MDSVYEVDTETIWIGALLLVNCGLCCVYARRGYCADGVRTKRKYAKVQVESETDIEAAELM